MKNLLRFLLCCLPLTAAFAETGDTLHIQAHEHVDMTWYGAYDQDVVFPDENTEFQQILMYYTLGCASGGCSDWDYTNQVQLLWKTGLTDSSVAQIDTISTNPLQTDTTWNYFPQTIAYELGRLITPYGTYMDINNANYGTAGFDSAWEHTFVFDVTDFAPYLRNEQTLRSFYSGWSSGFSTTISFQFIEGTPVRKVQRIEKLYSNFTYTTPAEVEAGPLAAQNIQLPNNTHQAKLRVITSGHGYDNTTYCGEFCERFYYVKVNGDTKFSQKMWRDDCGLNNVYPQGGTWIYNRGNWCPGDKVYVDEFELTPFISNGENFNLDVDFQSINWSGTQAPSYAFSGLLVIYEPPTRSVDAALEKIIAPSKDDEYLRQNPICGNPVVQIKNKGSEPLTTCIIKYGIVGLGNFSFPCYYEWFGNLPIGATENVVLPLFNWVNFDPENPQFTASLLEPNYTTDQNDFDNHKTVAFTPPPTYAKGLKFQFRTNNKPLENAYTITNDLGEVLFEGNNFTANTVYEIDLNSLSEGCYTLLFTDYDAELGGGDGISWWANSDETNNGYLRLLDKNDQILKTFEPDFGNEVRHQFKIQIPLGQETINEDRICEDITAIVNIENTSDIQLLPNPAHNFIQLDARNLQAVIAKVQIIDLQGKIVWEKEAANIQTPLNINTETLPSGWYNVQITTHAQTLNKAFVIIP
ncbi:MAG: peptide-N-glycosidase F-related protein [Chitinophagales bacterium]|nr:T9SS type A sorting domain-containing protein [Bacteroidota bacterium]MCB9042824.1 T9SS type A sorting domain-containing protein [Chitinophagales bacterium]